jgi:hypothetical protein
MVRPIVDYNPSRQIRLPDGHVGRSLVHPLQYAALIAMALSGQNARQKHAQAAGFVDSGRVQMSVTSPASIHWSGSGNDDAHRWSGGAA